MRSLKPSNIQWAGEMPETWEPVRLKECISEKNRRQPNKTVLSLSYGQIIEKDFNEKKGVSPESFDTYQGVHPGDVVLRLTDLQNDQRSLRVGYSGKHGIITSAYLCVRGRGLDTKFSAYLLHDIGDIQKVFYGLGGGVRQSMKFADLADLLVPRVPIDEQRRIAAWLDLQTSRIDKRIQLLDAKRGLLVDLRKTIITESVCQGMDETAELKFSGVDAIGKIPKRWKVVRLKELAAKIGSGKTPSGGSSVYTETGIAFIRSQNVWDEGITLNDIVFISNEIDREMRATRVKPKDILLNITGGSIGRSALVPATFSNANVNQHVCIIRLRNKRLADYVALAMLAQPTKAQIGIEQVGAARDGLNFEQVGRLAIPLPTLDSERRQIVDSITAKVRKIDRQIQLLDRLKVLLVEQRKALIHEAVTGKIDLSNYESPAQAA